MLLVQSITRGLAKAVLQFLSRMAGKPSGPGAAVGDSSSMALIKSSSEITIGGIELPCVLLLLASWLVEGLLNTLTYCWERISAISLLLAVNLPSELKRGPIFVLTFDFFFCTYEKK